MYKKQLTFALLAIALMGVTACEQVGREGDISSPVTAALTLDVSQVGSGSAALGIKSAQEEVTSLIVTSPLLSAGHPYVDMDAAARLALVKESGSQVGIPFGSTLSPLVPSTSYIVGALGLDSSGNVITAPTFVQFTTGGISAGVNGDFTENEDGSVTYTGRITAGNNVDHIDYIFNEEDAGKTAAELESIIKAKGTKVKTTSGSADLRLDAAGPGKAVLAAIPYDAAGNSGKIQSSLIEATHEDRCAVVVGDNSFYLTAVTDKVFEGTVSFNNPASFTILFNRDEFGFTKYSGNGGVGTVFNIYAAVPSFNYDASNANHTIWEASKAIGRMSKTSDGGESFWFNVAKASDVFVRADFSGENALYYLAVVETPDPKIVLKQTFDLFVWGGSYSDQRDGNALFSNGGSSADMAGIDGTEAAINGNCGKNYSGTDPISYGSGVAEGYQACTEEYVKNRDMEGWDFRCLCELPGAVRLSKSSANMQGWLLTPPLSALTAATDVTLTFDCARFGNNAGNVKVTIEGPGEFTALTYVAKEDGENAGELVSATEFVITEAMCPKYANATVPKPWSHIKAGINGATSETRIRFDATSVAAASSRLRLDNIIITK